RAAAQREFVFLWPVEGHLHLIHRAVFWDKEGKDSCPESFSREEGMGKAYLITIGVTKSRVLSQKLVQMSRAAAPVSKDKKWRLDADVADTGVKSPVLDSRPKAILQALIRNRNGAQTALPLHRPAAFTQEPQPHPQGDPRQHPGSAE